MNALNKTKFILVIALLMLSIMACNKQEDPLSVYDPNASALVQNPVIATVTPGNFAVATISKIKITGDNFLTSTDTAQRTIVYFNNKPGKIVSVAQKEIVVVPPYVLGDSVRIRVVTPGAVEYAEYYPYAVKDFLIKNDNFSGLDDIKAIEMDKQDNLYVFLRNADNTSTIYKVTPDGARSIYGTATYPSVTDMKFGHGGYLYCQRSANVIQRIPPGGGAAEIFVSLPDLDSRVKYLDFDENGNLYTIGSNYGMFLANAAGNIAAVANFTDYDAKSIRVFNGYVYISAEYSGRKAGFPAIGIFRCKIKSAAGDLADPEVVFDLKKAGSAYASSKIGPITFSSNGDIIVSTDNTENSIIVVHTDGTSEVLYPGFLPPANLQITWGNGKYIYLNRLNEDIPKKGIFQIFMDQTGAPYNGRK